MREWHPGPDQMIDQITVVNIHRDASAREQTIMFKGLFKMIYVALWPVINENASRQRKLLKYPKLHSLRINQRKFKDIF